MSPRWQSSVAGLAIAVLAISAGAQTVGDLRKKAVPVQAGPAAPVDAAKVREAYRRFLELDAGDPDLRAEALRRLADLELEAADAARGDGMTPTAGVEQTRAAILLYERLLVEAPDHPRLDSALYQLGRAWEAEGNPERALMYLDRLVAEYPGSRHVEEAQFRRGEILFSAQRWQDAETAYEAVIQRGSGSAFHEQALYKHGWSLFKQSRFEESSESFLAVLDRKLLSAPGVEVADLDALPRADRELVLDTMRVLGIQFTADDPAGALSAALGKHGSPAYEWRLHAALGDLLVEKERYTDAADTYRAYAARHPGDARSPVLQGRAIDAYLKGGFAELALEGKREYVELYAFGGPFWAARTRESAPEVVAQLKANIRDLAQHYHALAQASTKPGDYQQAARWYREFLQSFPDEPDSAETNYLLADLLFESGQFRDAAVEYERTAYERPAGTRSSEAAYAGLVARERHEQQISGAERAAWHRESIDASVRFATVHSTHPEAGHIWLRSARQQLALGMNEQAADSARRAAAHLPALTPDEQRAAWSIVADSSFDLGRYADAEVAYVQVLSWLPADAPDRDTVAERLGASVYKQGEARVQAGDSAGAVDDFLRVAAAAPHSSLVANAQHDAATLLLRGKDWPRAIPILEQFRREFPAHPLARTVPRDLAVAYAETGRPREAAAELERVADDADETADVRLAALLRAAELYEQAGDRGKLIEVWARYVERYPEPLDDAMSARQKLADLSRDAGDPAARARWLQAIIAADGGAGGRRSDLSRSMAAQAALELAEPLRLAFEAVQLNAPLPKSLKAKSAAMDAALTAYRAAADYGIAAVATAATFTTAEMYRRLARDLMASERPGNLDADELEQYELLLEEQAYPFEEKSIELHEANAARAAAGVYDDSVRASYAALVELKPARYRKEERLPAATGDPAVEAALADLAAGHLAEAEAWLANAVPQPAVLTVRGVVWRMQGRMAEAMEAYRAAQALDPLDPLPVVNLGVLLDLYLGQAPEALAEYERYQALLPEPDAQVAAWITEVRVRAGREKRSEEAAP
jgi:tetratricopeptide (TPR) repeat protein